MNKRSLFLLSFLALSMVCKAQKMVSVNSPDNNIVLNFQNNERGQIFYKISYKGKEIVKPSVMGFRLKEPATDLLNFDITSIDTSFVDESWDPLWGETKHIINKFRGLAIGLLSKSEKKIKLVIRFRAYNDGMAFRYEFPVQENLQHFIIADELTTFAMTGDHTAFWIPGDYDSNEYSYNHTAVSKINAAVGNASKEINVRTLFDSNAVQTPLMIKTPDGIYINIHEAALSNYPAMNLVINKSNLVFNAHLVPDAVGNKAYLQTPAKTPWRTILVSDKAATILSSKTILNCNEPSAIANTGFIQPQKFIGVWW